MSDQSRSRSLRFAVSTSLLTGSALLLAGCSKPITNTGPVEPPTVNEGPQPEPETPPADDVTPDPAAEGGGTPGPADGTDPPADPSKPNVIVNPGPQPTPKP